jgi:DNA-binding transcriptional LysR family regulator
MNFNKAANVLNYAQSTVSSQIQSLENSLGVSLFNRSGSKICLTQSGVKLLKYTQRLINLEDEILSNFKNSDDTAGNLIIRAPHSVAAYYLPPIIKEFQLKFPNIGFDFDACVGFNVNDIFNSGLLDIAFLIHDNFTDNFLHVEELTDVELVFVSNPNDKTFISAIDSVRDFSDKTLLLSKSDCSYRMIFEKMLIESKVKLNKTLEINSPEAVKNMLVLGCYGFALLPKIAVKNEISNHTLKSLIWKGSAFNAKLYMIWKKGKYQTEPIKAFVDAVRVSFGKSCGSTNENAV